MTFHNTDFGLGQSQPKIPDSMALYGALTFLAARCPKHRRYPAALLDRLFLPAVENRSAKIFPNAAGLPVAAMIWTHMSKGAADRMIAGNHVPEAADWDSGPDLWILDVMAPFGQGRTIARHFARNPPNEAFSFARVGPDGNLRKVVTVEAAGFATRAIAATFLTDQPDQ